MALTATQISTIRLLSGDDCTPYISDDDQLNVYYDDLGSVNCVILRAIQARLAAATKEVGIDSTSGSPATNPKVNQIMMLMQQWENKCTGILPTVGVSQLSLGIDEETTTFTNP